MAPYFGCSKLEADVSLRGVNVRRANNIAQNKTMDPVILAKLKRAP